MKNALVVGTSPDLEMDLERFKEFGVEADEVIVLDDAAWAYPAFHHWASCRPQDFVSRKIEFSHQFHFWGPKSSRGVDKVMRHPGFQCGGVGTFGVYVALEGLGCDRVVLAGAPFDGPESRHVYGRNCWLLRLDYFADRVRSMSGVTKELVGSPTRDWFEREEG